MPRKSMSQLAAWKPRIQGALLAPLLLTGLSFAHAQQSADGNKDDEIRQILAIEHFDNVFSQQMQNVLSLILTPFRVRNPGITNDQIQDLTNLWKSLTSEHKKEIFDILVNTWKNTYSDEEIDHAYEFFSSPLGRSFAAKAPAAMQEVIGEIRTLSITVMAPELLKAIRADEKLKGLN